MSTTYNYKMLGRPFDIGTYPTENFLRVLHSGLKNQLGYWSMLEYSEKIPDEDVKRFELQLDEKFDAAQVEWNLRMYNLPGYICDAARGAESLEDVLSSLDYMRTEIAKAIKFIRKN